MNNGYLPYGPTQNQSWKWQMQNKNREKAHRTFHTHTYLIDRPQASLYSVYIYGVQRMNRCKWCGNCAKSEIKKLFKSWIYVQSFESWLSKILWVLISAILVVVNVCIFSILFFFSFFNFENHNFVNCLQAMMYHQLLQTNSQI